MCGYLIFTHYRVRVRIRSSRLEIFPFSIVFLPSAPSWHWGLITTQRSLGRRANKRASTGQKKGAYIFISDYRRQATARNSTAVLLWTMFSETTITTSDYF